VFSDPVNFIDPNGLAWFRPDGHKYMAGREGYTVTVFGQVYDFSPGGKIGSFIDDKVPAGHTFASMHDRFVGEATVYLPDWMVNFTSMPTIYMVAVMRETMNSFLEPRHELSLKHELSDDEEIVRCKK